MNLNEVLTLVAAQVKADPKELIAYAAEDTLGGYHWNPALATFKQGSCWGVEGQMLYALVRWLKPQTVVEIGGWAGCSGAHLASAVLKNGTGHVYSVDNEVGGQKHGADLPSEYRDVVTLVKSEGVNWLLSQAPQSIGFLFEDADHSTELVRRIMEVAVLRMEPGAIIANHDAAHDFAYIGGGQKINSDVGRAVRDGLALANVYFRPYLAEPSDCGLAITLIPGIRNMDIHSTKLPVAAESKPISLDDLTEALQNLTPEQVQELLQNVKPLRVPQASQTDASPLIGNANIESQSEPPPVTDKLQQILTEQKRNNESQSATVKQNEPLPPGLRFGDKKASTRTSKVK